MGPSSETCPRRWFFKTSMVALEVHKSTDKNPVVFSKYIQNLLKDLGLGYIISEAELSMETNVDVPTLKAFRLFKSQPHKFSYQVTITPKGKGQTHHTLYKSFMTELGKYKCVKNVFLIAEFVNTQHFHGFVQTKDICKFIRLYNKKLPFNFHISNREELTWAKYILGYGQKQYI